MVQSQVTVVQVTRPVTWMHHIILSRTQAALSFTVPYCTVLQHTEQSYILYLIIVVGNSSQKLESYTHPT